MYYSFLVLSLVASLAQIEAQSTVFTPASIRPVTQQAYCMSVNSFDSSEIALYVH